MPHLLRNGISAIISSNEDGSLGIQGIVKDPVKNFDDKKACDIVGIKVLDHIVIGDG
ncbi:MAG: hypothetical protein V3U15_02910 [Nitrospinota bacterium]